MRTLQVLRDGNDISVILTALVDVKVLFGFEAPHKKSPSLSLALSCQLYLRRSIILGWIALEQRFVTLGHN